MKPLPESTTDEDLVAMIDEWAALLEREDYPAAIAFTEHDPTGDWTAERLRDVIKGYGDARADQHVTVAGGVPSDVTQRKEVDRWKANPSGEVGEIWYDLNIDGVVSDLTATFSIVAVRGGVVIRLNDVHVM